MRSSLLTLPVCALVCLLGNASVAAASAGTEPNPARPAGVAAADVNSDGQVDRKDLRAVRERLGARCGRKRYSAAADVNGDCRINGRDVALVRRALGTTVNGAPVATADTLTLDEDGVGTIAVLANDNDPNGDSLVVASITQGMKGAATLGEGGQVTYRAAADEHGSDVLTYTVSDGRGASSIGTISVAIAPVNDAPTVSVSSSVLRGPAPLAVSFSASAADADGDALTFAWAFGDGDSSSNQAPTHVFERAGTFNVSARVSDGQVSAEAVLAIEVTAPARLSYTAATLAGTGAAGESGEAGPALSAELSWPRQVVTRPDGVVFVVDATRLLQIDTGGQITSLRRHLGGDRAPVVGVGPDSALYYLESDVVGTCGEEGQFATLRVRRLTTDANDPIVAVVQRTEGLLGTCSLSASMAVASDGGFYVASPTTLFRIAPGENIPTWERPAPGSAIRALAPRADGGVLVSGSRFLHAVSAAGGVELVAGTGNYGFAGDDGPATLADLASASGIASDASGAVTFLDFDFLNNAPRVRRIEPSTDIRTIGGGRWGFEGDGAEALDAAFGFLDAAGLALLSDGRIVFADVENHRVRVLVPRR